MAFEAEITQSIRELQNAVAALSAKTKEANAGLKQANQSTRELATSTRVAAQHTREHETQIRQLGKVAKETGGAGGRMVKEFSEMAGFAPTALAAGAAIGVVASAAAGLTAELQRSAQAQREIIRLAGEVDNEVRQAGVAAVMGMDVPGQKKRALAEIQAIPTGNLSLEQIASEAERLGGTTKREAIQRLIAAQGSGGGIPPDQQTLYAIATGRDDANLQEDQRAFTAQRGRRFQVAAAAGNVQSQSAAAEDARTLAAAEARLGGQGVSVDAVRANTKAMEALTAEMQKDLEGKRSMMGRMITDPTGADAIRLEAQIREKQAQIEFYKTTYVGLSQ